MTVNQAVTQSDISTNTFLTAEHSAWHFPSQHCLYPVVLLAILLPCSNCSTWSTWALQLVPVRHKLHQRLNSWRLVDWIHNHLITPTKPTRLTPPKQKLVWTLHCTLVLYKCTSCIIVPSCQLRQSSTWWWWQFNAINSRKNFIFQALQAWHTGQSWNSLSVICSQFTADWTTFDLTLSSFKLAS